MKTLIATVLIAVPLVAANHVAVAATPAKKTAAKKPAAKAKPGAKAAAAGAGAAAAAGAVAAAAPLGPEELAMADRVFKGRMPCELGAFVNVAADEKNQGYFFIDGKGFRYHMMPVRTSTGAVRLEDKAAGAVWLQIANKSMLMNQKAGQRLADECMSPEQQQVAEAIKKAPPPSLLDAPKP